MDTEIPVPLAAPVGYEFVEEEEQPEPKQSTPWRKRRRTAEDSQQVKKAKGDLASATELDQKIRAAIEKRKAGGNKRKSVFSLFLFIVKYFVDPAWPGRLKPEPRRVLVKDNRL